jgi:hypothetical protein
MITQLLIHKPTKSGVSIEEFYEETGYTPDTTIDAWKGEVFNPNYKNE